MNRGIFSSMVDNNEVYNDSNKEWIVELSQSTIFWYDLIKNPNEKFNTKSFIVEYMSSLKELVEKELEKRFIYFIFSRKKVRFNINKKPKYTFFSNELVLEVLVGRDKKRKKIKCFFPNKIKPKVEITEKFITLIFNKYTKQTLSVHDFLLSTNINIGESSEVHYVGYTKNPNERPLNGNHSGLNDILYSVSNEENDIFICFNLFKVISNALNVDTNINFVFANSMIDEIDVNIEGLIIEKCFILYFNALNQSKNKENELGELKNNLQKLVDKNKINSIQFNYEFEEDNEYWSFYSTKVDSSKRHTFTVNLKDNSVNVEKGSLFFSKYIRA